MPTAFELLWPPPARPKRGPKPSLTLEGIVSEAIALADAEGLANLSMQRLADQLGCAKMALYRYVPGKSELTALMLDTAFGAPPEMTAAHTDSAEPWRAYLRVWTETIYDRFGEHPWALELTPGIRPLGPNEMSWLEHGLTALDGCALTAAERFDTVVLLLGHARSLLQQVGGVDEDAEAELAREMGAVLMQHGDRFPQVAAALAEQGTRPEDDPDRNNALDFGIDRILDGLGAYIGGRK
ncbi:TetR/AcrR family transcriptional regulator [Nocardia acidivorans]|uniref:TetR/AcrR family transcriptional regulator n=1 Tax=Nocardia acidivorans TaxID=404580 RepID=UPI00082AAF6A|nr:TetR/AcrR family transcriptional regulator C-terminal domain-containing protein [Nocardia acidivorans]